MATSAVALSACATVPFFAPVGPPIDEHNVEAGIGVNGDFGRTQMGLGTAGWLHAQVVPDFELVMRGSGMDIFNYDGKTPVASDVLFDGGVGVRGLYRFQPTLIIGGEALVDYEQRTGGPAPEQLISGIVGIPVAEAWTPDIWVYTDVSVGIAIALQDHPQVPFFGFQEIPLGIVWRPLPWLMLAGEGGVSLPLNGGYLGVAAAFRL